MANPSSTKIVLASTFTADYVVPALTYWLDRFNLHTNVQVAPFDQLFQMLLSPTSDFGQNRLGINVALVRASDWISEGVDDSEVAGIGQEFVAAAADGAGVANGNLLVVFCPSDPSSSSQQKTVLLEKTITGALAKAPGVQVIGSETLQQDHAGLEIHNAQGDRLAAAPFEPAFYTTVGSRIARSIYGSRMPGHKVLVLDCDDTLWGGLCSELGYDGIELDPGHLALQQFAVDQASRGVLICLASRNNEADVLEVFSKNTHMILKPDHLAAWQINWGMKSESLATLSSELGLGLDSFVFIDDDPVQVSEVQSVHPQVLALRTPAAEVEVSRLLRQLWSLDNNGTTRESADRGAAYRDHAAREQLRTSAPTLESFLQSLDLNIQVSDLTEAGIMRAAELSQRTNQFNLTGTRFSQSDVRSLLRDETTRALTVSVTDRFGDYGTVGFVLCRDTAQVLEVFGWYLSCRALGRGVEHHMLRHLGRHAVSHNLRSLQLTCVPSEKNRPALEFVSSLDEISQVQGEIRFIDAELAAAVKPRYERPRVDAEVSVTESTTLAAMSGDVIRALTDAATTLADPQAVHRAVHGLDNRDDDVAPAADDPVQTLLRQQFSLLLGVDEIDDNVGFFELGGHSLQAVQILAAASNEFEIELDPTLLFTTNFSIAELQDEINHLTAAKGSYQGVGGLLDQISQMTD